jgi:hypothetical protein
VHGGMVVGQRECCLRNASRVMTNLSAWLFFQSVVLQVLHLLGLCLQAASRQMRPSTLAIVEVGGDLWCCCCWEPEHMVYATGGRVV